MTNTEYQTIHDAILSIAELSSYIVLSSDVKQDAYIKDKYISDYINADSALLTALQVGIYKRGDFLKVLNVVVGADLFDKLKTASLTYKPLEYVIFELENDGLTLNSTTEITNFITLLDTNTTLDATDLANVEKVFTKKIELTPAIVSVALRGNSKFTPI